MSPDWYARLLRRLHSVSAVDPLPGLRDLRAALNEEIRGLEETTPPRDSQEAEERRRSTDRVVDAYLATVHRRGGL